MKRRKRIALLMIVLALVSALFACSTEIPTINDTETKKPATTSAPDTEPTSESSGSETAPSETEDVTPTAPQFFTDYGIYDNTVNAPRFSVIGGYVSSAFDLELAPPEGVKGVTVRYTTDGSIPTAKSKVYTSPLPLLKTGRAAVIRAACFDSLDNRVGYVATQTYILRADAASPTYTVSIAVDQHAFDRIVQNYNQDIEIPAHVEIVTPDGVLAISQDAGLAIYGGSSRSLDQKSFKITARKTEKFAEDYFYGTGSFKYPFFDGNTVRSGEDQGKMINKYDSLILRNGGNDSALSRASDPLRPSLLRDNVANNFAAVIADSLDYANSVFAEVFINGSYYGVLDMKENMNDSHVRRVYGVEDTDVVVIKSELDTRRGERFDGTWFYYESDSADAIQEWEALCSRAIAAIGTAEADAVYEEISQKIDIKGFIEYTALNLYVCNTDWPHNNVKLWKYIGEPIDGIAITDGKWHFMTRDLDIAFARYDNAQMLPELDSTADLDTFYRILGNYVDYSAYYANDGSTRLYPDSLGLQGLFTFCMTNPSFRTAFCEYCAYMTSDENTAVLRGIVETQAASIESGIQTYLTRWSGSIAKKYTFETWKDNVNTILDFVEMRPAYFTEYLNRAVALLDEIP